MSHSLFRRRFSRSALSLAALLGPLFFVLKIITSSAIEPQSQAPAVPAGYASQVQPILQQKCMACHNSTTKAGGLLMETYETLLKGGSHGPAIVPGKSGESRLVLMLEGKLQPRMPFGGDPLPAAEIASLKAWIDTGAPGPHPGEVAAQAATKGNSADHVAGKAPAPAPSATPAGSSAPPLAGGRHLDFNREIRPILSDNCFACHGPDEQSRQAKLRLDTKEGIFADRGGYKVIVAGKSADSRLYQRISSKDTGFRMPPAYSNRTLTPQQVELVREWIDQGAKWELHWSFVPPKRPAPPEVKEKSWPRNAIDNFVLARLESEGLKPSPVADKGILLRRVTFDLTGLPPTQAELDSFLADRSADAYEKRVDQLLASPHYGERMAMQWLDVARYADTHGYHIDSLRQMWHWRDWLINAYNQNMPYDQFTVQQLAGDLLPDATVDQKIATGFNRNHMINFEGGAIPDEYQTEYVVDRVSTTATAWLGLTLGCARCHDHKYDPIKQKEFYRFYAFFNTIPEKGLDGMTGNAAPVLELPSPEQEREREQLNSKIAETLKALPEKEILAQQADWEKTRLASMPATSKSGLLAHWEFDNHPADTSGNYHHGRVVRGQLSYADGRVGQAADFSGETQVDFGNIGAFDRASPFSAAFWFLMSGASGVTIFQKIDPQTHRGYEVALDDTTRVAELTRGAHLIVRLIHRTPDNAIEVRTKERLVLGYFGGKWHHVALNYDGSGKAAGIRLYVDGKPVALEVLRDHLTGSFQTAASFSIGNKNIGAPYKGQLDDLRLYNRALTRTEVDNLAVRLPARALLAEVAGNPPKQVAVLRPEKPKPEATEDEDEAKAKKLSKEEQEAKAEAERHSELSEYFLTYDAPKRYRLLYAELKELRARQEKLEKSIPTAMVMQEAKKPRETFVLGRGDYRNRGEKVGPGVPSCLPPLAKDLPRNRLGLAKWLIDPANPLTARVAVNRYWQEYFGSGLVKTAEDFGTQGEPPSHPELLDWLATEFVHSGWNVKAMQRLIVTSATYRQSSRATPELLEKDPENRLLARGPRFRLPAELVRDNALAIGGLLNPEIGGPSAYPYQPKGIWEELAYGDVFSAQTYEQQHGKNLYRRSMYTVWKRTAPPPALTIFDAPDREKCTARRTRTNTPLQALVLMNDPTYVEAARSLAQRILSAPESSPEARLRSAFRLATARDPQPKEVAVLMATLQEELADYNRDKPDSTKLLAVGESKYKPKLEAGELAAWTTVASMILNLDETITKE
jgi:mono/diheme cytochrome c family protein